MGRRLWGPSRAHQGVHSKATVRPRGHGSTDSVKGSPQEVEGRDLGEMVHVSNTKGGREPRSYLSGYFIIRMSKVRVSRFQWRRVRRERAGLGHGLFGGNRQVPPRSSTSLYRYTNPRQYTGSAFQWLVESRSGMRYKRVCEVEFCFKKVYSDSKDVIARMPRAL